MLRLKFKYKILLVIFFLVLITSLWPKNIYLLVLFSFLTYVILPTKKLWDPTAIVLFFFSSFYLMMTVMTNQYGSGFVLLSMLMAPVGFYRFGRWLMHCFHEEKARQKLLIAIVVCYLLPLFILTIKDVALVGIVNVSRVLLGDADGGDSLAATLYGLMASVGISCISALFAKGQKFWVRLFYIVVALLSIFVVIHLVNRTGLVVCICCLLVSLAFSTKMRLQKIIPVFFIVAIFAVSLTKTGIISEEIISAYQNREMNVSADAAQLGGRSELWIDAIHKLATHPLGWARVQYAHNLWLDIARVGGWFALLIFFVATYNWLRNCLHMMRRNMTPFLLTILSLNTAMFLSSFVEPVIEGSILFFSLFMLIWGLTQYLSAEVEYK